MPAPDGDAADPPPAEGIWHARWLWVTVGAVALIFLAAMQSLAVTTVMPIVSVDLHGEALYAVAFAGTLATSVIGMVMTGAWCDRTGPLAPLSTCVALFVTGLVIAGAAPTMEMLVAGRLVQGLGTGGQVVALYVVVARVYPAAVHGRVFAAFSAAWVVPSLIGPLLAGALFGAEIYVPHLLIDGYGFSPTWAGLGLTAAALAWAVAADVSGRLGDRLGNVRITVIGVSQLVAAAVGVGLTAAWHLHPAVAIVVWAFAGGGMGLMYPRLTVLTLAYSTPQNQGFNSSALSIFDATGSTTAIAVMGLVFTGLAGTTTAYAAVFGVAAALALLALVPGLRLRHAREAS